MGKTTDAHIAKIESLSSICTRPTTAFSTALIRAKAIHHDIAAAEQLMTSRHQAIFGNGTGQSVEKERAITRDAQWIQANGKLEELGQIYEHHCLDSLNPARASLRQGTTALEKAIKEFETFVAAKEKGWFTSKKSVPAAREAIRKGREYLGTLKTLVQLSA
ncbi:MAG TPA: hypothetical protein VME43_05410 [Bryobacteraceae bacterium]|nr:hypothetical protein [Bryobacteraceae bacterium]